MKTSHIAATIILCATLTSCAFVQKVATHPLFVGASKVALTLTQVGVDIAMQSVLIRAQSSSDLTNKGNLLDSAASALRSLQGASSDLVTPEIVVNTLREYTNPAGYHWADYADKIAVAVAASSLPQDKALEALAVSANEAAAKARAQAALALPVADGKTIVVP
jgi:hypothetical protein